MSSAAPAVKAALVTALAAIVDADTLVSYGNPGPEYPEDVIAVMDVESASNRDPQTLDRTRTETLNLSLSISCARGGGAEVQQTVTERAYALLALVETYVKTTNPTLGGLVWGDAVVIAHTLSEAIATNGIARIAELYATVQFHASI